jgi:hypothetical protein
LASRSPDPKIDRNKFEAFVKNILGVTKPQLDARLAEEKRTRRKRAKREPG